MAAVLIYTTRWCAYCTSAKTLLKSPRIPYVEVLLDDDPAFRTTLMKLTGGWTVPQIVIDSRPMGGYVELARLARTGRLDELLDAA